MPRSSICGRTTPGTLPESGGRSAHFSACDVRDADAVTRLYADVSARYGRLDVLVNNAGGGPPGELADAPARLIERIIQLNLTAPLLCAQGANQLMQAQPEGGCIINIGSVAGDRPSPVTVAYGAAKAGLLHATQSLAMEWGPQGAGQRHHCRIRCDRERRAALRRRGRHRPHGAMFPLKRLAEPADLADACLYLASPLAAYVSGALLAVHGGGEWPLFLHLAKTLPP